MAEHSAGEGGSKDRNSLPQATLVQQQQQPRGLQNDSPAIQPDHTSHTTTATQHTPKHRTVDTQQSGASDKSPNKQQVIGGERGKDCRDPADCVQDMGAMAPAAMESSASLTARGWGSLLTSLACLLLLHGLCTWCPS